MQVPKNEKDTNVTSNEELVRQIYVQEQVERAFQQLILNLRPMMIKIGRKHLSKIPIYDLDDYVQEGSIILWQLMKSKKYNWKDKFSTLFYAAFERRCINLYRDYVLKNMIVLTEAEDIYGYGYHLTRLVEDEYAKRYREKHREECRRWYEKHRKKPNAESRPKLTEEEKKERSRQKAREYYIAHREQCIEAKRKWYRENHEYALKYQRAYDKGVRITKKSGGTEL